VGCKKGSHIGGASKGGLETLSLTPCKIGRSLGGPELRSAVNSGYKWLFLAAV
jgi:hypothetical protein